ncbi:MAG: hypothetical protein JO288_18870, partial [Hyphomicrobiales bacterium]|nr:hypothetical protein [Hyphomicrobiales bacterium]
MSKRSQQLVLDWQHEPSFAREDFLVAHSNREALRSIDLWPDWPTRMLLLEGPEGAGKSHLAALWVKTAHAVTLTAETLPQASMETAAPGSAVLIEDADRIGQCEEHLFHLVNRALQNETWLLITARAPPSKWKLKTPDLLSRLRLAPAIRLEAPDIELTEAVLFKLFSDRQLHVEPHVVAYIAMRIERSLGAA